MLMFRCSAASMLRRFDAPLGRYAPRPHLRDVALTPLKLGVIIHNTIM